MKFGQIAKLFLVFAVLMVSLFAVSAAAPVLDASGLDLTAVNEDAPSKILGDVTATDLEDPVEDLIFSVTSSTGAVCTINAGGSDLTFEPADNFNGAATCTVRVTDTDGEFDEETVSVTVNSVNDAPVIVEINDMEAYLNEYFELQVDAEDVDDTALAYSLEGNVPSWLSINEDTGLISGTPAVKGVYEPIRVVVSDGDDANDEETFKLTVSKRNYLIIYDLDAVVYKGGDEDEEESFNNLDDNLDDDIEVAPGDELVIRLRIENLLEGADDEIEEIEALVTIEAMGDEDEQEEDAEFDDLDAGEHSEEQEFVFEIPLDAEEDAYELLVELEGDNADNGDNYKFSQAFTVNVKKDKHSVAFAAFDAKISQSVCGMPYTVVVKVVNVGTRGERDVQLKLVGPALGISVSEYFDLDAGDSDDSDTYFKKTYTFVLPEELPAETYPISGEIVYDDGKESTSKMVTVNVGVCVPTIVESAEDEDELVEVVETSQEGIALPSLTLAQTTPSTQEPLATPTGMATAQATSQQAGFFESNTWFGILVSAIILVVVAIIVVLAALVKK